MAIIQDWMPPTRENYELILFLWQFFPVVSPAPQPDPVPLPSQPRHALS